jgi:anti-sigma factor RsiW
MNRDEARLILQSCRPGGQDAADPQFAAALALAKQDAELAAWFAGQQKFDAQTSREIKSLRVPPDLKAKILAQENLQRQKIVELPGAVWWRDLFSFRSPVSWAMAALILMLFSLAIFWNQSEGRVHFADYSARMVYAAVNDTNHVDVENSDMKQVVAWLAQHHGESRFILPVALNGSSGLMGCRVLDWHGRKVSMLCYGLNGSGHVDLFVTEADIFPDAPPVDRPQFASSGGMPTASWSHDGKAYLMVGHGNAADLEKVLQPKQAVKKPFQAGISFNPADWTPVQSVFVLLEATISSAPPQFLRTNFPGC